MIGVLAVLSLAVLGPAPPPGGPPAGRDTETGVVVVRMVDEGGGTWRFEPSAVEVTQGEVLRFIQMDVVPHNVQFKSVPAGADLGAARMGPFLLEKGDTYDLVIDSRFVPGVYQFVCTPHEAFGMEGTLVVKDADADTAVGSTPADGASGGRP